MSRKRERVKVRELPDKDNCNGFESTRLREGRKGISDMGNSAIRQGV